MTADQLELITAAVDGELSATEGRAFRALIASSDEARALYKKLKADSDRVRALPRVAPPAGLQAKILARIATAAPRGKAKPLIEPRPVKTRALARRVPAWLSVGLAAGVFLCIAAASFGLLTRQDGASGTAGKKSWSNALPADRHGSQTVPSPASSAARPNPADVAHVPVPPAPAPRVVTPDADAVALAPEPRLIPDVAGSQMWPKLAPFARVQVRVPFLRAVSELDREDIRQELFDELRRDPAFRFDVFVRDTARGAEVFQTAAKAAGLTVFADAATLDKMKKRQAHAVVIYTESLTPAELAALFAKLAIEDAKVSPRIFDSLHATPVIRSDETELKAILGQDLGLLKRLTAPSGAGQGGEPKSVSAGTIDSLVKAVTPQSGDKPAVLLTWQTTHAGVPRTNPAVSAELKQYLAKRGERMPNAVPAIIVIRPVG